MDLFSSFDQSMVTDAYDGVGQQPYDYHDYYSEGGSLVAYNDNHDAFGYHGANDFCVPDYASVDNGNAHCLLCEADPLMHAHHYHCHPLLFGEDGRPLVHVNGYFRDDGTYVEEHFRTAPDGNPFNNFSTK